MPAKIEYEKYYIDMNKTDDFVEKSGREIYNELSHTMLNKRPINELQSHILKGHIIDDADKLSFTPRTLSEYILVDGSFILSTFNDTSTFLDNIQVINEKLAFQFLCLECEKIITRRFDLFLDNDTLFWLVTEYEDYGDKEKEKELERYILDFEQLYIFDNKRGVLYDAQKMYRDLESNEISLTDQMAKSNLKTIITGYPGDIDQAMAEFASNNRVIFMTGDTVKVIEVANPGIVKNLMEKQNMLEPRYLISVHLVILSDTSNISGISRKYLLTPMRSFVELVRKQMVDIYNDFGFKLAFSKSIVDDADERKKEFELLEKAKTYEAIDDAEFKAKVKELII